MASTKTKTDTDVVEVEEIIDQGNWAVEEVPQTPEQDRTFNLPGVRTLDVDELPTVSRTDNFLSGHNEHTDGGVVDLGPTIVEPEQEFYDIRVTADIESVFLGPGVRLPEFVKGHGYRVPKRVYDYLVPKGLVEGR